MAYSYRYFAGRDGRHYCYAKDPTFRCPLADPVEYVPNEGGEGGEFVIRGEPFLALRAAAEALGVDAVALGKMLRTAHQRAGTTRARVDGKLTGACAACGHRLDRLGFRAWVEREPREEELNSSDHINQRLMGGPRWRTDESHYFETKKEAIEWAREESKLERTPA